MVSAIVAGVAIAGGAVWSSATADEPSPSEGGSYVECMRGMRGTADTLEHWSYTCVVSEPPIVVGEGPQAVYLGPNPTVGGDPARGETELSYYARTGRHLPGRVVATVTTTGGDPAAGETEDSYYARTGRHLGG